MTEEQPKERSIFDDPVLIAKTAAIFRRAHDRRLLAEALAARDGAEGAEDEPGAVSDPDSGG